MKDHFDRRIVVQIEQADPLPWDTMWRGHTRSCGRPPPPPPLRKKRYTRRWPARGCVPQEDLHALKNSNNESFRFSLTPSVQVDLSYSSGSRGTCNARQHGLWVEGESLTCPSPSHATAAFFSFWGAHVIGLNALQHTSNVSAKGDGWESMPQYPH